ncbi:unnamed protein product [Arctogadus glacialis]
MEQRLSRGVLLEMEEEDGHGEDQASGGDPPEGSDLTPVRRLLEREASKQEQRWRSVQMQLNQLREDVEADRRPSSAPDPAPDPAPAPALAHAPAPAPAPAPVAPVTWPRAAIPRLEEDDDIEQYLITFHNRYSAMLEGWNSEDVTQAPHCTSLHVGALLPLEGAAMRCGSYPSGLLFFKDWSLDGSGRPSCGRLVPPSIKLPATAVNTAVWSRPRGGSGCHRTQSGKGKQEGSNTTITAASRYQCMGGSIFI